MDVARNGFLDHLQEYSATEVDSLWCGYGERDGERADLASGSVTHGDAQRIRPRRESERHRKRVVVLGRRCIPLGLQLGIRRASVEPHDLALRRSGGYHEIQVAVRQASLHSVDRNT